ncbi:MAG: hypothetical protein ACRC68_05940 [Clostridium sp.]
MTQQSKEIKMSTTFKPTFVGLNACAQLIEDAAQKLRAVENEFNKMGDADNELSDMAGISFSYLSDDLLKNLARDLKNMAAGQKVKEVQEQAEINKAMQFLSSKGMVVRVALEEFETMVKAGEYEDAINLLDQVYPEPSSDFVDSINARLEPLPIDNIEFWHNDNAGWFYDEAGSRSNGEG